MSDVQPGTMTHRHFRISLCVRGKRIIISGQKSDGDGGAGEKKERTSEAEVVGEHNE